MHSLKQRLEIQSLKETVELLSSQLCTVSSLKSVVSQLSVEVSALKSQLVSLSTSEPTYSQVTQGQAATSNTSHLTVSPSQPHPSIVPSSLSSLPASSPNLTTNISASKATNVSDRKYNVIVFGVKELPSGSSRFARDKHDFSNLRGLSSDLEHNSEHSSTICDCCRLGKFKGESSCRPLLAPLIPQLMCANFVLSQQLFKYLHLYKT